MLGTSTIAAAEHVVKKPRRFISVKHRAVDISSNQEVEFGFNAYPFAAQAVLIL
jgi:hypothetical protein